MNSTTEKREKLHKLAIEQSKTLKDKGVITFFESTANIQ